MIILVLPPYPRSTPVLGDEELSLTFLEDDSWLPPVLWQQQQRFTSYNFTDDESLIPITAVLPQRTIRGVGT